MKTEVKAYRPVYPSPAALITSVDAQGRSNVLTLGEVFNISINEPVILGIAIRPATYSHGLFLVTVVAMRVDADKLGPGGKILTAALDPIIYLTGEYWSIGERIGTFGFTSKIPSR